MSEHRPLQGLRALVIEDDYLIADDLRDILRNNGAELVKLSGSVGDAFGKIMDDGFEFALLDINLGGDFSFLLAHEFARRRIPFAFVSGYERRSIPRQFDAVPNWGKPYDDRQIVGGIRALWTRPLRA